MAGSATNSRLLKAYLALREVSRKELGRALNRSASAIHRKLNGKTEFTASEIQACVDLLNLDMDTAKIIFFAGEVYQ